MNCRVLTLVAAGVAFSLSASLATASPKKAATPSYAKTATGAKSGDYSQDQVDGIVSAVVDDMWAYTDVLWHHGDHQRIIALDRVIVEADKHFEEPYSTGGWLMESYGNNADAEAFYKLGVTRNPDSAYMYYSLGMFYFNTLKDYGAAVKVAAVEVTKNGADINDWRLLAHSYEHNNQLDKALETWKAIKRKFPTAPAVDHNLQRLQKLVDDAAATPAPPAVAAPTAPVKPAQPVNPTISL